ncbi:hypothetical protein [Vannielia litorea]|uniref:hypothetical protein n=1 Tax=Vannielia TaxID=2813041 RepID=UPI001C94373D|nr:hypothetical protein [Vannielia litorea]MBY6049598.1 hypothetical protein [Vannielia litorea]MBY6077012.1 hypothetical protein [Vannielia litorea]
MIHTETEAHPPAGTWLAVSYRLDDIRHATPGRTTPHEFCEEAMVLIEASLEMADLGHSTGTQEMPSSDEPGALWISFSVSDPVRAERVIRKTVRGTSYGGFAAISRADPARA